MYKKLSTVSGCEEINFIYYFFVFNFGVISFTHTFIVQVEEEEVEGKTFTGFLSYKNDLLQTATQQQQQCI